MAVTISFKKAVEDGDVKIVRIMLKESLLADPTFEDFNEKSNYASSIGGIYAAHDGRELNPDESTWDDDYMNKLMSQLSTNFSKERFDHLKRVVRKLRPVAARPQAQASETVSCKVHRLNMYNTPSRPFSSRRDSEYQQQKRRDLCNGSYRRAKIAGGVVAGAVVGGIVAALASVTVVGGVATGAVAGGAVTAIVTKGEK